MSTAAETRTEHIVPHVPALLRVVLAVFGASSLAGFYYSNARSEEFRLAYPAFGPTLWNLYLTLTLASLVGIFAMWYARRWGYWLLVGLGAATMVIELYAMGFQFATLRIPIVLGLLWFTAQPAWKTFH